MCMGVSLVIRPLSCVLERWCWLWLPPWVSWQHHLVNAEMKYNPWFTDKEGEAMEITLQKAVETWGPPSLKLQLLVQTLQASPSSNDSENLTGALCCLGQDTQTLTSRQYLIQRHADAVNPLQLQPRQFIFPVPVKNSLEENSRSLAFIHCSLSNGASDVTSWVFHKSRALHTASFPFSTMRNKVFSQIS